MKRLLPLFLSLMLLSSCGTHSVSESSYRQISMDEAVKMMKDENNYIILDVRRVCRGAYPGIDKRPE